MAVRFSQIKTAIHNSGENGMRKANNGISVLTFGAASKDTPLWKYGALKSITSARVLNGKQDSINFLCVSRWSTKRYDCKYKKKKWN